MQYYEDFNLFFNFVDTVLCQEGVNILQYVSKKKNRKHSKYYLLCFLNN